MDVFFEKFIAWHGNFRNIYVCLGSKTGQVYEDEILLYFIH
jgi:hypothetical protein